MIIAVDIGNTTASFGFFKEGELELRFSLPSSTRITPDKCWKKFQSFIEPTTKIKGVIFSSVSPYMTNVIKKFFDKYVKVTIKELKSDDDVGIVNCYEKPQQLGADRMANALAAKKLYKLPSIIIDLGTAITIDVIDEKSAFIGGIILPGIGTSAEALHKKTSLLPKIELVIPQYVLARNTISAIQSGLTYGFAGMLKSLVRNIIVETGIKTPSIILTGGHSRVIEPLMSDISTAVDPDLTLKGLYYAYITM